MRDVKVALTAPVPQVEQDRQEPQSTSAQRRRLGQREQDHQRRGERPGRRGGPRKYVGRVG